MCELKDECVLCLISTQVDAQMSKDRQVFYDASLQYVFKIQEVQERKKFEFVEPVRLNSVSVHVSFERCKDSVIIRQHLQCLSLF